MMVAAIMGDTANSSNSSRAIDIKVRAIAARMKQTVNVTAAENSRVSFSAAVNFAFSMYSAMIR
jgi:hypothetical protein